MAYCSSAAGRASPYEQEEIVFLLNVAGVIRKEPLLLHLFLPAHEHSWAVASFNPSLGMKAPVKNTLFENAQIGSNVRRVSLLQDNEAAAAEQPEAGEGTSKIVQETIKPSNDYGHINCDCTENDSFILLDTILRYFDSAVSGWWPSKNPHASNIHSTLFRILFSCKNKTGQRCCGSCVRSGPHLNFIANHWHQMQRTIDIIQVGLSPQNNPHKSAKLKEKFLCRIFTKQLSQKLAFLCQEIPEDMDAGEIEDCACTWG